MKTDTLLYGVLVSLILFAAPVLAVGKKPLTSTAGKPIAAAPVQVPKPFREAFLAKIKALPFTLPNGAKMDLSVDLRSVMESATARGSLFRITDNPASGECDTYLEIRAALTTLDLDVFGAGIKFGYSPTGEFLPGSQPISGTARVDVGLIGMDFSVWRCSARDPHDQSCAQIIASRVTHSMVDAELKMQFDFSQIQASADLIYKTPLGNTIAKMMTYGMSAVTAHERFDGLPWRAEVREVAAGGKIWISAGEAEHLAVGDAFSILAPATQGACDAYRVVGTVKAVSPSSPVSLSATVEWQDSERPIRAGDVVMIRKK